MSHVCRLRFDPVSTVTQRCYVKSSGLQPLFLENQQQKDLCSLFCVNLHLNIYKNACFAINFLYEKKAAQIAQVNDMLENSH